MKRTTIRHQPKFVLNREIVALLSRPTAEVRGEYGTGDCSGPPCADCAVSK